MKQFKIAVIIFGVLVTRLRAQTVVVNNNLSVLSPGLFGAAFDVDVYQDAAHIDDTGAGFNYDGINVSLNYSLADEGIDCYVVMPGDAFTPGTIQAGKFLPIVTVAYYPYLHPPAYVGFDDFYLGISTGLGYDFPQDRTAFGWVLLHPFYDDSSNSFGVTMVDNVMSYDSPGIIVGTAMLVPEPAGCVIGGLAVAFFGALRRRRPH